MIKSIGKLIAGINGYQRPGEIAAGCAFGVFLGVLPGGNLLWWLFFIVLALVKINKGAMILCMLLASAILGFIDPLLHAAGYAVLTIEGLYPFFAWFAVQPLAALTRFNNSLVMGSLVLAIPLWLISYLFFRVFIRFYRQVVRDKFIRPKLVPWLKKIPFVKYIVIFFEGISRAAGAAWQ